MNVTAHNYNGYQFSIQWSRAKGLECTATHYKGSEIVLNVQYAKPMSRCPHRGEYGCVKNGSRRRRIQTVPIGSTQLFLNMKVQRYRCNKCGHNGY